MAHISDDEMKEFVAAWEATISDVEDYMDNGMDKLTEDERAFLSVWLIVCHDAMEEIYHEHLIALKNAKPDDHETKWDCIDSIFIKISYLKDQLEGAEGAIMKLWSAYNRKYPGRGKV